jgi:1-acyl-sn-glycerol-3-phosphate acyltransferase
MIVADKRGPWARVVRAYVDRKVRRAFRAVWVRGALPPPDARLLLYANHTSFWDGFALHALCRAAGWDGYCLMEERNLARYRFLRRLGAFSIRRGDPQSALESLRHAAGLLQRPGTAVIVFPEGELQPWDGTLRPLEGGLAVLARRSKATCLPVAIRYRFFEHELPDLLLAVGGPHDAAPLDDFAARLAAQMDLVRDDQPLAAFRRLVPGRRSVMERWDAVRGS